MRHFLCGSSLGNFCRLLWLKGGVSPRYWLRCGAILVALFARLPFSIGQHLLFHKKTLKAKIDPAPIFILGHWRSGTTYLQELLLKEYKFNYLSYLQALLPWDFLGEKRGWRFILRHALPKKRPMDCVELDADAPAEEGLALANMTPFSFYHVFVFPARLREMFCESVLFEGSSDQSIESWKDSYLYLLKKVSLETPNNKLLLKDPAHTAHIPLLLKLFPDAKFIFLWRQPKEVVQSMIRMCQELSTAWALQSYSTSEVEEVVPWMYDQVMQRYLRDKELIPPGNLVEINYEDLVRDPNEVLRFVSSKLGLCRSAPLVSNSLIF